MIGMIDFNAKKKILEMYDEYHMKDVNENFILTSMTFDEFLRRCKLCYQITRDECEEIGYNCTCPVFTLYAICKHTVRLAHDRNELDLHPDLDFRVLGCQEKRGRPKKKRCSYDRDT